MSDEAKSWLEEMQGDLLPELEPYVRDSDIGPWLAHPLVHMPFHEGMGGYINRQYEAKRQALGRAKGTRDWHQYVFLHERPYRVQAFVDLNDQGLLTDQEYWSLLAAAWVDSENIREFPDVWEELLSSDRDHRKWMMDADEVDAFDRLPDTIKVFQGHTVDRDDGWSWTTDEAKAEWFARRFARLENDAPLVTYGQVEKRHVLAYLTRRGESEVLVDPDHVTVTKVVALRWEDE